MSFYYEARENIGDRIKKALADDNQVLVNRLRREAQTEFDLMVQTDGTGLSMYADIRELYQQWAAAVNEGQGIGNRIAEQPTLKPSPLLGLPIRTAS